jgi:uracil-DNA glycosylase
MIRQRTLMGDESPTQPLAVQEGLTEEQRAWELNLQRKARQCRACPLYKTATQPVLMRGSHTPKVLFVGEAPGDTEDKEGFPFVGDSGRLLETQLAPLWNIRPYAIINILAHRPPDNKYQKSYGLACSPLTIEKIEHLRPRLIAALGRKAEEWLAPRMLGDGTVRVGSAPVAQFMFLYHPSGVMRNRGGLEETWHKQWAELERRSASL